MNLNKEAKVAVVMCVRNEASFLQVAIDSILNQSYQNFNFYIINDCSDDNTKEIILSYTDTRVVYIENQSRQGLGLSLKNTLSNIQEKFILRMDGDDLSRVDRLEKLLEKAEKDNYAILGSTYDTMTEDGKVIGQSYNLNDLECIRLLRFKSTIGHPTMLISTYFYHKSGGYSGITPASDYDLLTNFAINGFKIGMLNEPLLAFRIKQNSTGNVSGYLQRKSFNYILRCRKKRMPVDLVKFEEKYHRAAQKLGKNLFSLSFRLKSKAVVLRLNKKILIAIILIIISALMSPLQMQFYVRIVMFKAWKTFMKLGINPREL